VRPNLMARPHPPIHPPEAARLDHSQSRRSVAAYDDDRTEVKPPSTARICPVMCFPASLARSTAAPFRSSASPMRRSGTPAANFSSPTASMVPYVIFEGKKPGASALTVIPCRPQLPANARVKLTTAPLLVL